MLSTQRRNILLRLLQQRGEPMTGTELAQRLGVSRQVIVQDVAVLRAAGEDILATPQGYLLLQPTPPTHRMVLATRHSREETAEELTILVDHGLRVLDAVVEHPLYGELRAPLMLASRADVQAFMARLEETGAVLLSHLTGGVHLHTVDASSPEHLAQAREALRQRGYLLEAEGAEAQRT
ncbi:MAG: transcription repressor NadR [Chloroflexi bacterium]|nr:transcription repressor NadR [Chloroflexota bacterium]